MGKIGRLGIIGIVMVLMVGCKTMKVVEQVPVEVHDTLYRNVVQHDSIHIDHFREVTKMINDTILVRDSTVIYRWQLKTDTAYKVIERPVAVTRTEIKEVEKSLFWWQKWLMWLGVIAIVGGGVWVVLQLRR